MEEISMLKTAELYDMSHTLAGAYLSGFEYPWQALKGIKELILALGPTLGEDYTEVSPTVWVHKTATAPSSAAPPWWAKTAWWAIPWS